VETVTQRVYILALVVRIGPALRRRRHARPEISSGARSIILGA
jgi:hypothetical protein